VEEKDTIHPAIYRLLAIQLLPTITMTGFSISSHLIVLVEVAVWRR
jgi:hypothetical protein